MNGQRRQGIGMTSRRTRERLIERLFEQGIRRIDVLDAMRETPRHLFIDEALSHRAYEDIALPIGEGQTISQPYIVARMTEVVISHLPANGRVLEIGTGCGYQSAVLAKLVKQVYTVERIASLYQRARKLLAELNLYNVHCHLADGTYGWARHAPYDGIIATAATNEVPNYLLQQLADGGVLIIPVGDNRHQYLKVYRRQGSEVLEESLEAVMFVPFLRGVVRDSA